MLSPTLGKKPRASTFARRDTYDKTEKHKKLSWNGMAPRLPSISSRTTPPIELYARSHLTSVGGESSVSTSTVDNSTISQSSSYSNLGSMYFKEPCVDMNSPTTDTVFDFEPIVKKRKSLVRRLTNKVSRSLTVHNTEKKKPPSERELRWQYSQSFDMGDNESSSKS